jgi:peptide deformylase
MALRKIATIGHPVLRQAARELTREELGSAPAQRLVDDLVDTMRDANGAGIAANQVHEAVRVCVVEIKDNPRYP